MKTVDEIILDEKDKNVLGDVTFIPPRFGTYTLGCILLGIGIGLIKDSLYFGGLTLVMGLTGMLYGYIKRESWK